jgi:FAD/FMN-containing dehydrogenase
MIEKAKLVKIVGASNVLNDKETLDSYSRDISFVTNVRPAIVVKPKKAADVKELVKLANETKTPLVPVSSGAPHFRGDTVPGIGGAVIVDMSGMKKILNVDRARRVAMVEAGVTFGELIPAAKKEGIRLNLPFMPKSSKSVVASLLDREAVVMPGYQWDVSDPLACIEVYFGSGDEFRTGQAAGPGTIEQQWKTGAVQKAPYGPGIASLHRLVQGSQGAMGVVTWASMRCEILPTIEEPYVVSAPKLETLIEMAALMIRLRMVNECFILNNADLATIFAKKFPKDYLNYKASLPAWTLFYVVAGYNVLPEERVSSHVKNISEITQRLGIVAAKSVGGISAAEILKAVQQPCADPYWKTRYKGASEDIIFLTLNDKVPGLIETMDKVVFNAGYPVSDMGVYVQPIVQGTSVHVEFNLPYDPANAAEAELVRKLSLAATKALLAQGAFFSRPYGENSGMIMNRDAANKVVLTRLKNLFDPNHVMNPGKIGF